MKTRGFEGCGQDQRQILKSNGGGFREKNIMKTTDLITIWVPPGRTLAHGALKTSITKEAKQRATIISTADDAQDHEHNIKNELMHYENSNTFYVFEVIPV